MMRDFVDEVLAPLFAISVLFWIVIVVATVIYNYAT